jgi:hypothetical protein
VEGLAGEIEGSASKAQVAPILEAVKKTEAAQQALQKQLDQEVAISPLKAQAAVLKRQLAETRAAGASPEVLQKLERQIKELEKRLPE